MPGIKAGRILTRVFFFLEGRIRIQSITDRIRSITDRIRIRSITERIRSITDRIRSITDRIRLSTDLIRIRSITDLIRITSINDRIRNPAWNECLSRSHLVFLVYDKNFANKHLQNTLYVHLRIEFQRNNVCPIFACLTPILLG